MISGMCSVCGRVASLQTCRLCGRQACPEHYVSNKGLCLSCQAGKSIE